MLTSTAPWEIVIIGGGTAGLSAALILARARRRVLVLDEGEPRNRFAPHMHGVLSRDGYSPLDLIADGRREVRAADGVIATGRARSVARIDRHDSRFELVTDAGERIRTARLIVASGIRDTLAPIPGLSEHWGRGVVACPYCDGYEARNGRIGVLLGSPAGQHKAHMLRSYSSDVTVFTALVGPLPEDDVRILGARGIRVDDRRIETITTEGDALAGVQFADGTSQPLDALFAEPTMEPQDKLLRQLGAAQDETLLGRWTTVDSAFQTSIPGVFAVGNVVNPGALVPIAAAAGVTAAVTINSELVGEDVAAAQAGLGLVSAGFAQ